MSNYPKPDFGLSPLNRPYQIIEDVKAMIAAIESDKAHRPSLLYIPDEGIISLGGNPELHKELIPGVRIVEMK
jgi:hypothetical protein